MSDLIDDLHDVMRILMEDAYPAKYAYSVSKAICKLEQQANKIKELESSFVMDDADCYCE